MELNEIKKDLYKSKAMAKLSHYVSGNLYYNVELTDGVYQFPITTVESNLLEYTQTDEFGMFGGETKFNSQEGLKLSEVSKKDMETIAEYNSKNSMEIENISLSINEQAQASAEITLAISNITESSTEIEGLSSETTEISNNIKLALIKNQKMVNDLNKLVDHLKKDLEFFKF